MSDWKYNDLDMEINNVINEFEQRDCQEIWTPIDRCKAIKDRNKRIIGIVEKESRNEIN